MCILQNGSWQQGLRTGEVLPDDVKIWDAITASVQQAPDSLQRLYFLDGTFPGELPPGCNSHEDIPGQHSSLRSCAFPVTPATMLVLYPVDFCVEPLRSGVSLSPCADFASLVCHADPVARLCLVI